MGYLLNGEPIDIGDFLRVNDLDPEEIEAINNLAPGESFVGGGGAWAEWTIARAEKEWNPRFVAYAADHDNTPEEQLRADDETWPGGRMTGFMLWIRERWQEWALTTGHPRAKDANAIITDDDHRTFDAWLRERKQRGNVR
jgi:hypothetical protein